MCENMSYSSAQAALAEKDERGSQAKQTHTGKPSWILNVQVLSRLLLIISTFPPTQQQRLYQQTLLKCLENRRFFARRTKLGRLSQTPSMNSSRTWTSGDSPTTPTSACRPSWGSDSRPELSPNPSSDISLRLMRKTSGLFNSDSAGNDTVAGKASNVGLELSNLDKLVAMETSDILDFGEVPLELTEADYLDSFMDLSNFLNQDVNLVQDTPVELIELSGETMTDFSDIFPKLSDSLLDAPVPTDTTTAESTAVPSLRKRKRVDYSEELSTIKVTDTQPELAGSVSDHDYMVKKRRLDPSPSTSSRASSSSSNAPENKVNKYRERRDKNNVASRRSREIRKEKFVHMEKEAEELEVKNEQLRIKIEELEKLATVMKADLIKKMTAK